MKSPDLAIFLFKLIPQNFISRLFGLITRIPLPEKSLSRIIQWYSAKFGVLNEYIVPDDGFRCFANFFVRQLKPGSRPIAPGEETIVSPVDARIDQFGTINDGTIIQAKGIDYSVRDLIPEPIAEKFMNGSFMTLYLSPGDYHRIHSPVSGMITGYLYVPGRLFTVQEYMARGLRGLFTRNERLITFITCKGRPVAVCKVGAMNVGRIALTYDSIVTNRPFRRGHKKNYADNAVQVRKGDEIGMFHLGSTVILVFPENFVKFNTLQIGSAIQMGQPLGAII